MKPRLLSRVQALEMATSRKRPCLVRYGWATDKLPDDFQGERHFAAVNCWPGDSAPFQWCEFEERAGHRPTDAALNRSEPDAVVHSYDAR